MNQHPLHTTLRLFCCLENQWADSPRMRPLMALAVAVAVAALPVLLLYDTVRSAFKWCLSETSFGDHHFFYSSPIFIEYQRGLKQQIQNELIQHPELKSLEIVQWIENPVKEGAAFYQGFVERLRKAISSNRAPEFIERLCHWVFTGSHLLPATTHWMREQAKPFLMNRGPHNLADFHRKLAHQPIFQGETFPDYRPYDPLYLGDAPTHLFKVGDTGVIRTPAVTNEKERSWLGRLRQAAIVPEFEGYLRHCQRNNQTHLYINLMARHGSEKVRIEALEKLESDSPSVLQLATLSKDCEFYHQKGPFSNLNKAAEFKKVFLEQMFSGENPAYHWPKHWDRAATQKMAKAAIEKVHAKYFPSSLSLNREQRCTFIELAYTEIIESLIRIHKPAACNVSCRSCVDRGAVNLALLYAQTQPSQEALAAIALAPALLTQGRTMFQTRLERLIPALANIQRAK